MPDFIITFDNPANVDTSSIERLLRNRPGVEDLLVQSWNFSWGTVSVQQARCFGYSPLDHKGELYFSVGRPRVMGWKHEDDGPSGMMKYISKLAGSASPVDEYSKLTGLYVCVACTPTGATLFTDRMGAYPVYYTRSKIRNQLIIGTHPEIVAQLSGRQSDLDAVSLAEIMIKNTITFPFTTRTGMEELPPGSKIQISATEAHSPSIESVQLWLPREPNRWPSVAESVEELEQALRFAGEDLTRSSTQVAATLSGGADSRVVLSCIPPHLRSVAITYADHINLENETAAKIARAANVEHRLIIRPPEMYAEIPTLEASLLGYERGPGHCHGYALKLSEDKIDFDLLLCGDRADTLYKGYYVPRRLRAVYRNNFSIRWSIRNWNTPLCMQAKGTNIAQELIKESILDAIYSRVKQRIDFLSSFRPRSAIEWYNFYPLSRHEHISYANSCMRFFPHDLPFVHSKALDVAANANPRHKSSTTLSVTTFNRLAGKLNQITNANDGLPANSSPFRKRVTFLRNKIIQKFNPRRQKTSYSNPKYPWFTNDSWVDLKLLQLHSRTFSDYRRSMQRPLKHFCDVFKNPPDFLHTGYDNALPITFQYNAVHLAHICDNH